MRWLNASRMASVLLGFLGPFSWGVVLIQPLHASDTEEMRPIAEAGSSRYAALDPVVLDGTGSWDPDRSGPLSYAWRQIAGPTVVMTDANSATPTISSFVQAEAIQECEFQLVVSDGELASRPDEVRVVIVPTFTGCSMTLENTVFDPQKPTVVFFAGGSTEQKGGGPLGGPALWFEKANVISFSTYVADPGTFAGAQTDRRYERPGDMIIVYLSAVAPDYRQPIQTVGHSIGGLLALDVALRLNLTYADARYAVNHATLLDPSAWVLGTPEYYRRVAALLANPVDEEQCWVEAYEAANESVCPSALNVVFPPSHAWPLGWYLKSVAVAEDSAFNHGLVAGAYWSVVGPGRNLQLASTPDIQTYKFRWCGDDSSGYMDLYDASLYPAKLPEPVSLLGPIGGVEPNVVVLTCQESENAVGYELLAGSDPYRVMDYTVLSDTPTPPNKVITSLPFKETWWTVRVRDLYGSTIYADPRRLSSFALPIVNVSTGKRYSCVQDAIDDAVDNEEIVLGSGTYCENVALTGKGLRLRSTDPNEAAIVAATVIKGSQKGPVVSLCGAGGKEVDCVLEGLTLTGGEMGVSCRDARITMRNCTVGSTGSIAIGYWHGYEPVLIGCTLVGQMVEADLLACWNLDETEGNLAHDSGASGPKPATLSGGPIWQPTGGKIGGALQFDGINDCVTTPVVGVPPMPVFAASAAPFSIFAWVKGGAPGQVVISQPFKADWLLAASPTGGLGTGLSPTGIPSLTSDVVITDGDWHRIGLGWDGSHRILYVDDILVAEDHTTGSLKGTPGALYIGAGNNKRRAGTLWSGLIDDVRIYNRAVKP